MSAVVSETKRYGLATGNTRQFTNAIVFIDSTVEDYQSLVDGVVTGTEVVVLDARRDGVRQISEVLVGYQGVPSLHIVSHGRPGSIQIGTTHLSLDTLANYTDQLQSWAKALADEASILLYGCNVAVGQQGAVFVHHLSQLTGKAIAASRNKTGNLALGGDWELAATSGKIKAPLAFRPEAMLAYGFVLNTTRVSVSSNGTQGNDNSFNSSISADGRYVAFDSIATNLVPNDTNGERIGREFGRDIFVHDRITGTTRRVSVSSNGTQGDTFSLNPSISADARYVVFESYATNLVPNDTNGQIENGADIFVYDRQTGNTTRVSVNSAGAQANDGSNSINSSISVDGRYVAFESDADNLVPGDTNDNDDDEDDDEDGEDIFVHDRQTGNTTRVSVSSSGTQGNNGSSSLNPSISGDGRYVAFESDATNLVPGDTNDNDDIFVRDRITGTTHLVSVSSSGTLGNDDSNLPSISGDGRYVAFESDADNLVPGDTNDNDDIFVHDRQTGNTIRVSVSSTGTPGDDDSRFASISADGRYVAFESDADNLVPNDNNDNSDVFVHDRITGTTRLVSVSSTGTPGDNDSSLPAISAGGQYISFESDANNLATGDTNDDQDIFVFDRGPVAEDDIDFNSDGQTDILWRNEATGENAIWLMNGTSRNQAVFTNPVTDLDWTIGGAGDFNNNGQTDILWRDQVTGQNVVWLMDETIRTGGVALTAIDDPNWSIGGADDFNSDGQTDILWRNEADGRNAVWLMDGTTRTGGVALTPVANTNWSIGGTGDFNSDAQTDILWRNEATGENAIWLMDGTTRNQAVFTNPVPNLDWTIGSAGDFNSNGQADILWRNEATGENAIWLMDGTTRNQAVFTNPVPNLDWTIGA